MWHWIYHHIHYLNVPGIESYNLQGLYHVAAVWYTLGIVQLRQSQWYVTGLWWLNNLQTFWTSSTATKLIPPTQLQNRNCSQYRPVESIWGRVERDFHLFPQTRCFKCLLLCLWCRNIFGPTCCKTIELLTPFLFNALSRITMDGIRMYSPSK